MKKILLFLLLVFPLATFSQEEYSLSLFEKFTGEAAGDNIGMNTSVSGDINNDGYDDILVGAYGNDDGGIYSGAAYLIYGQAESLTSFSSSDADAKFTGEADGDRANVVLLRDINNDGYDDILVGAYGNDLAGTFAGAVYLIYGQSTPYADTIKLSTANAKFTGEAEGDCAGIALSSAGDVNNDGYNDILISAYGNDDGGSVAGADYLIYGKETPFAGTISLAAVDAEFTGEVAGDSISWSVASAGDVNNDGYDDILIGADSNDDGGALAGAAYIIYGQAIKYSGTISLADADAEFTGEAAGDHAGWSVSSVGDLNNDSYDDFLIGANGADSYTGAAYLIYGQATLYSGTISLSDADVKFTGEAPYDDAGYSVSNAGDVNNDGYDDILIGADGVDNYAGAVYLIYGQETLYSSTINLAEANFKFTGEAAFDWAYNASSAGDVNSDGYDDILVGAYGNFEAGYFSGAAYLGYLYIDADHDGLLGPSILSTGTDTNDNDHDNDGIETDIDCNDDDINVGSEITYYQDNDLDGLGNSLVDLDSCTVL
ncbi:MAG: integrin alpha, partial [Patescibacteria group bacterium]